jgi:5-oxoprolinase (ATP-hydrolysing) subunit A
VISKSESQPDSPGRAIDLNADLGEGCVHDRELLQRVSSASICCGAHAGDPASIRQTLRWAADCAVVIGAHPGYADRQGFGRREQVITAEEVEHLILEQVETLRIMACEVGLPLRFLKPHGALYNQAQSQEPVARGVLLAAGCLALPLLGQPGTLLERLANEQKIRYIPEGFPDRRYDAPGSLVPRTQPGAVLHDPGEIESQVVRLVDEGRAATLCIHGDEPGAVANADLMRRILSRNGIAIRNFMN